MSVEKSQKIVKVLGILSIIAAIGGLLAAIGMFSLAGAGAAAVNTAVAVDGQTAGGLVSIGLFGVILLVSSITELLQGIFSLRAAKDASKVQPLWVISIISVVMNAISLVNSFSRDTQSILTAIFALIISCFVFYLANNIKKNA